MNTCPTHFTANNKGNILDLILTNDPDMISNIEMISPLDIGFPTDHHILDFDVTMRNVCLMTPKRQVYNYKAADIQGLKKDIQDSLTFQTDCIAN